MSNGSKLALVVGDINADVSMALPAYPPEGGECVASSLHWGSGGAGVNTSTALAKLGGQAMLLGRVGCDPAGEAALRAARAAGVVLDLVQRDAELATGLVFAAVSSPSARSFFSFRGANAALDSVPPQALLAAANVVHVSSYTLLDEPQRTAALATAASARALGVPLSLDLAPPPLQRCHALVQSLLPGLAALFLNQEELAALFPTLDEAAALAQLLALGIGTVALKRGPQGCSVLAASQRIDLPALDVAACDSTGCGDAFAAGLLWAWLQDADLAACAALANLMGGLAVTAYGSADALPTREQAYAAARAAPEVYAGAAALLARTR